MGKVDAYHEYMAELDGGLQRLGEVAAAESDGLEDGTADEYFQQSRPFQDDDRGQIDIVYHVLLVRIQCQTGTTIQHTIRFFMLDFAWCANTLLLVLLLELEPNSLRRYPILRGAPHIRSRTSRRVRGTSQYRPCNLETEGQNEFGMRVVDFHQ